MPETEQKQVERWTISVCANCHTPECGCARIRDDGTIVGFVRHVVIPESLLLDAIEAGEAALDLAERAHAGLPRTGEDYYAHRDFAKGELERLRFQLPQEDR